MDRAIVFEDSEAQRKKLVKHLRKHIQKIPVEVINGSEALDKTGTYDEQLENLLRKMAPQGALIVCDKDLSKLGGFIGLSGTIVGAVADKLGFPLCLYARGEGALSGEDLLKSLAPWEKKRIILEWNTEESLAEACANIYRAFSDIERGYEKLRKEDRTTPAAALSRLLGQLGIEDRIALYGTGEQGLLEEIMPYAVSGVTKELTRRMPRILGNWLYTSILRFPGILVYQVPAASYLNIDPADFGKPEVQDLFAEAEYNGPFSGLGGCKWWWRHKLDDLLELSGCEDGFEFAKSKEIQVRPCNDSQTGDSAGYYCMVTKEPVSDKNSKSGISWFPAGSDLARIRLDKFNELAPWVGLY